MTAEYRYLEQAFKDCKVVEVRHQREGRWESGLFNDLDRLMRVLEDRRKEGNLFTTLNRPVKSIVVPNRFGEPSRALRNDDIEDVKRIVFDLDPIRPKGVNSTAAELKAAAECRDQVVTALRACGWPVPALAISGNGSHAVWRTNVRSDEAWKRAAAILYQSIRNQFADLFDHYQVHFDTTVRNPARIWRLYGHVNRKGPNTPDRPQRIASVWVPSTWEVLRADQVNQLVERWEPSVIRDRHSREVQRNENIRLGSGDYRTLDAPAWFMAHGHYLRTLDDEKHAVKCPWSSDHTSKSNGTDTVIFVGGGNWPRFHCSHSHCEGRGIRDVIALWGDADQYCTRQMEGRRHG